MYCIKSGKPGKSQFQHIIEEIHGRIPYMKICPGMLLYIITFIEIFRQQHGIVQIYVGHDLIINIRHIRLKRQHIYWSAIAEKILCCNGFQQKHIIIKINKIL